MDAAPYSLPGLSPDAALAAARAGAFVVLLDVPPGTAVGVDHQAFVSGPRFRGVKMVPPGVHAVTTAAAARAGGGHGPAACLFAALAAGDVLVRRWSAADEALVPLSDADEEARLAAAARGMRLDDSLGAYDLGGWPAWRALAGHVDAAVLGRVAPVGGVVCGWGEPEDAGPGAAPPTAAEAALEAQLRRGAAAGGGAAPAPAPALPAIGGRCYFTPLPRLVKTRGLSPAELTAANLDKSAALEALLAGPLGGDAALLGEFQFAFLAFLLGHSAAGFAQWKALVHLMLGCRAAARGPRAPLFAAFLRALGAQLAHGLGGAAAAAGGGAGGGGAPAPADAAGGLLADELFADTFLRRLAGRWLRGVLGESPPVDRELAAEARRFARLAEQRLGWCLLVSEPGAGGGSDDDDDDDDDDGPVVVDAAELLGAAAGRGEAAGGRETVGRALPAG